jgi:hypothetical protein
VVGPELGIGFSLSPILDYVLKNPVVTRAAENYRTNRIMELICPFLPPRVFAKCLPIRRMVGRGGGDRTHDLRLKRPLLYH